MYLRAGAPQELKRGTATVASVAEVTRRLYITWHTRDKQKTTKTRTEISCTNACTRVQAHLYTRIVHRCAYLFLAKVSLSSFIANASVALPLLSPPTCQLPVPLYRSCQTHNNARANTLVSVRACKRCYSYTSTRVYECWLRYMLHMTRLYYIYCVLFATTSNREKIVLDRTLVISV